MRMDLLSKTTATRSLITVLLVEKEKSVSWMSMRSMLAIWVNELERVSLC